jgi:hypothetical protein
MSGKTSRVSRFGWNSCDKQPQVEKVQNPQAFGRPDQSNIDGDNHDCHDRRRDDPRVARIRPCLDSRWLQT